METQQIISSLNKNKRIFRTQRSFQLGGGGQKGPGGDLKD